MATINCDETEIEKDNFKHVYKFYKRRDRSLDTSSVINFSTKTIDTDKRVEPFALKQPEKTQSFPGLKPFDEWRGYQLKGCEGFIVIPNPFEAKYQRYWVERCLLDFPIKPNKTNLDAHMARPSQVWHKCLHDGRPDLQKESLLMKLRWATLGYQYEWNTKEYFSDRIQTFPDDLSHMCSYIAEALGYSAYSSEAGIVNYYRMESTLMGHTDVSELDKAAPLISFSFGQSCIFLIGGPSKETEPIPLFLHSGDICLMTGPARLSFHAVPRIHPGDNQYLQKCFYGDDEINNKSVCENNGTLKSEIDVNLRKGHENGISNEADIILETEEEDPYSKSTNKNEDNNHVICSNQSEGTGIQEVLEVTPTVKGDKCTLAELREVMDSAVQDIDWGPFNEYLGQSRINVNVRQVLKSGLSLNPCPDVIVPLCEQKK